MDFKNDIPFDLGLGQHLQDIVEGFEFAYAKLNNIKNFNIKKSQFQSFYPVFIKEINNYINFYIGCLIWAYFIKQFEDKEILNNPMLNKEVSDENGNYMVDYLINFLSKFEKDVKYYMNKPYKFDQKIYDLLNLYKKFLTENKQFTNTKTSKDLIVPIKIENPDYDKYLNSIQQVVNSGDFSPLREYLDLLINSAV